MRTALSALQLAGGVSVLRASLSLRYAGRRDRLKGRISNFWLVGRQTNAGVLLATTIFIATEMFDQAKDPG